MRRTMILATAAGGLLVAGLAAGPALATGTPSGTTSTTTCPCRGTGPGTGPGAAMHTGQAQGSGRGPGAGWGAGGGTGRWGTGTPAACDPLTGLAKGTLTGAQRTSLAGMAEQEKLARDVHSALAATTKDLRFTRIAAAETRHLTEIRALLSRYGVSDPTAGKAAGQFATAIVQQRYRDLVARGSASLTSALAVGREIETADLAALSAARAGVTAPDALAVYDRLAEASQAHLRAFAA